MKHVLNFGSLNIDHVYQVEHFVRPGETLLCSEYRHFAGGKGFTSRSRWQELAYASLMQGRSAAMESGFATGWQPTRAARRYYWSR